MSQTVSNSRRSACIWPRPRRSLWRKFWISKVASLSINSATKKILRHRWKTDFKHSYARQKKMPGKKKRDWKGRISRTCFRRANLKLITKSSMSSLRTSRRRSRRTMRKTVLQSLSWGPNWAPHRKNAAPARKPTTTRWRKFRGRSSKARVSLRNKRPWWSKKLRTWSRLCKRRRTKKGMWRTNGAPKKLKWLKKSRWRPAGMK